MNLEYMHIKGEKQNNFAISFCLFKSDKFNHEKHIEPFEKFIQEGGQKGYDNLLFYKDEKDLTDIIKNANNIRLFKVCSDELYYDRHLWRYLGCNEDYCWTWFRGMDSPIIPKREMNLQFSAEYSGCDLVIWSRLGISCMGKFCIRKRLSENLLNFLKNFSINDNLSQDWNCDEKLLSCWVNNGEHRIMLALDQSLLLNPHQEDWLIQRLRHGNHIVIVKDRDDRNIHKKQ